MVDGQRGRRNILQMPNDSELMKRDSSECAYIYLYTVYSKQCLSCNQGFLCKLSFDKLITQTTAVQLKSPNCYLALPGDAIT